MDLRTEHPYWLLDKGILSVYPSLQKSITTEVAIIGAGVSGALIAWHLCKAGLSCTVIEKRHIGMGSTAATTGLLQYETDTSLTELAARVGSKNATDAYLLCSQAIDQLGTISKKFSHAEFARRPSLKYASFKKDVSPLKEEYSMRKAIGLKVDWLETEEIIQKFGFAKEGAILSEQGAAINAYGLSHALLGSCEGLSIYDRTEIKAIVHHKRSVELTTATGHTIRSRKLVIACGYESGKYLPKKVDQLHTTYALVSEPFPHQDLWFKNALIWETADPYLYFRTTRDNRIMMGGKDDEFTSPVKREAALPRKIRQLEKAFANLFPAIQLNTDFYWAGSFASTRDGLPYIGCLPGQNHVYFALGFGGNGIVFSQLAATIIRDAITGKTNAYEKIFSFNR